MTRERKLLRELRKMIGDPILSVAQYAVIEEAVKGIEELVEIKQGISWRKLWYERELVTGKRSDGGPLPEEYKNRLGDFHFILTTLESYYDNASEYDAEELQNVIDAQKAGKGGKRK